METEEEEQAVSVTTEAEDQVEDITDDVTSKVTFFEFIETNHGAIKDYIQTGYMSYQDSNKALGSHDYLKYRGVNFTQFRRMSKSFGFKNYEKEMTHVRTYLQKNFDTFLVSDSTVHATQLKAVCDFLLNEYCEAMEVPHDWVNRKW